MSGIAQTSYRYVASAAQSAIGTPADTTASDAKKSRRKNFSVNFTKNIFESGEKTTDFMESDFGHGQFIVSGDLNGNLYAGEWQREFEAICRRDMTAAGTTTASSGDGFTISSNVVTRANGANSFITDGHRVGHVVRLAGLTATADNNREAFISALTATTATLVPLDGIAFANVGTADENATMTGVGQYTYIPETGHTEPCYTLEDHHKDIDVSSMYYDFRWTKMSLKLAPNSYADITFSGMGTGYNDDKSSAAAPYFTSPAEPTTYRALTGIRALLFINNVPVPIATNFSIEIDLSGMAPEVIASQISPDVFYGPRAKIRGDLTALLKDLTLRTAFRNESEVPIFIAMYSPGSSNRQFVSFYMDRVKINANTKDDPDSAINQSGSYAALKPDAATGKVASSIMIQDSQAS